MNNLKRPIRKVISVYCRAENWMVDAAIGVSGVSDTHFQTVDRAAKVIASQKLRADAVIVDSTLIRVNETFGNHFIDTCRTLGLSLIAVVQNSCETCSWGESVMPCNLLGRL